MIMFRKWASAMRHAQRRAHDTGIRQQVRPYDGRWAVYDADHQRRYHHA